MVSSRLKIQYCKVIIATSLVWFLLDVFLLMYFTDCTMNAASCADGKSKPDGGGGQPQTSKPGILNRLLPREIKRSKAPAVPPTDRLPSRMIEATKRVLQPKPPEGPGEMGKPVIIPKDREGEMKERFKINQFNLLASEMISVNRTLPDVRMEACKRKAYPSVSELPDTSVVIVFHNEAWSTLLRTIHSVINRSPRPLLREVILVDDASERDFLGSDLEKYIAQLSVPVVVERMGKRSGLIRARLKGASRARGKVITFLDAHCECTEGWLEPLVAEIHKDRTSVVCPIIDVISDETFEYVTGSDMTWGGFNWKLNFRWYPVPQREMERRGGDRSMPLRSPTMAGGLFAIDRDYFYEIGSYDHGMDIWGGENLEMSFRIWMCQGTLLIVTCSHVGHVFRKATPYTFPGGTGKIINHNNARLAEVWMDEWKEFYYKINPGVRNTDFGDVTERKGLREKLKCKSFRWYLENIYPESQMPLDYFSLGEIRNKDTGLCLDSMGRKQGEKVGMVSCHGMGGNQIFSYTKKKAFQTDDLCLDVSAIAGPVKLYQCHGLGGNQLWEYDRQVFSYTKKEEIMTDDLCLDVSSRSGPVKLFKCHGLGGNQKWKYDRQSLTIKHTNSNQCLDKPTPTERDTPSIGPCSGSPSQQWVLSDIDWKKMDS